MALVDDFESIIFDYGGVLVGHQTQADQARMADAVGLPLEQFTERYWTNRADYDKGALTAPEYWMDIAAGSKSLLTEAEIDRLAGMDADSWMDFDEVMWEWLAELSEAGKRIAILSNMPRELGEALKGRTERLNAFDQVTLSYEVRSVKPEPVIYEHCLEGLDTPPERTLFFDDRMENIQGAELLGIRAIQFLKRDDVLLQVR